VEFTFIFSMVGLDPTTQTFHSQSYYRVMLNRKMADELNKIVPPGHAA
jgi:hypothetical protein